MKICHRLVPESQPVEDVSGQWGAPGHCSTVEESEYSSALKSLHNCAIFTRLQDSGIHQEVLKVVRYFTQ